MLILNKPSSVLCVAAFLLLAACETKEEAPSLPEEAYWLPSVPSHLPPAHYQNPANPTTKAGFELGRSLFYDPILSSDSTVSCGSCHDIAHAFADHGTRFSKGVFAQLGTRNAPPVVNMRWYTAFMWDGGINHLEIMPVAPITSPVEMNESMAHVIEKLQRQASYRQRFKEAFGTESIDDQKMLYALSQFMAAIVSVDSKYDRMRQGLAVFTAQEQRGYVLFQSNCNQCHTEPLFTNFEYHDNGIAHTTNDQGRFRITQMEEDMYKFKVPGLRNVSYTYPYMHDGRFANLRAVLEHYQTVAASDSVPAELHHLQVLSDDDLNDLTSFLLTLNDPSLLGKHHLAKP